MNPWDDKVYAFLLNQADRIERLQQQYAFDDAFERHVYKAMKRGFERCAARTFWGFFVDEFGDHNTIAAHLGLQRTDVTRKINEETLDNRTLLMGWQRFPVVQDLMQARGEEFEQLGLLEAVHRVQAQRVEANETLSIKLLGDILDCLGRNRDTDSTLDGLCDKWGDAVCLATPIAWRES